MCDKLDFDFSNYCRTCGTESLHLRSLYHDIEHGKPLAKLIKTCTSHSFYEFELRPKSICLDCVTKLKSAYEFYLLIESSDEKFKTLVSSKVLQNPEVNKIKDEDSDQDHMDSVGFHDFDPPEIEQKFPKLEIKRIIVKPDVDLYINKSKPEKKFTPNSTPNLALERLFNQNCERVRRRFNIPKQIRKRKSHAKKPERCFQCYECKKIFLTMGKLSAHLKDHDAIVTCRFCMKNITQSEYSKHLCVGTEIECQFCSKIFTAIAALNKHINTQHKDHPNYKCYECAKQFPAKKLLEIHRPTHEHQTDCFVCDICDQRFKTRFQIKEHMEINHTDRRSFLCPTCGKNFTNRTTLRLHQVRHTPTKPIACPQCPKRFFDKHGLKKHMEVHDEMEYVCDICGSVMRSKASYLEHMRRHKKTKVYTCEVCSKQIKSSIYNLKLHMYTHTGEKPFKCPYCDRRYTQNADLNKHLRTHVGQNTYKCDVCEKSFRLLRELRKHTSEHYIQSLGNQANDTVSTQ